MDDALLDAPQDTAMPWPELGATPPNGYIAPGRSGDESLNVRFYRCPFDDEDHVEIRIPGDKLQVNDHLATEFYQRRFPRQWAAFQGGGEFEGQIRLETVPWMDPGNLRVFQELHQIYTVEQLAGLPNSIAMDIPNALALQRRAVKHLEEVHATRGAVEARQENAALRAELEKMAARLAALEALPAPPAPKAPPAKGRARA